MMNRFLSFLTFLFLLFAGELKTETALLEIGSKKIVVEVASSQRARIRGLMERTDLEDDQGMLFIFPEPEILSFWMKNTPTPLSIAFFDANKKLIQIENMPVNTDEYPPSYQSLIPCLYALEMKMGWFEKNKITPGMKFTLHDQTD